MNKGLDLELARLEEEHNAGQSRVTVSLDPMQQLESYEGRFEKKPWLERNRTARKNASWQSKVLQVISALLGFYGAKVICEFIPIPIPYIEYVLAIALLYLLERAKRKFSDRFWDSYYAWRKGLVEDVRWGYGVANVLLFCISLTLSGGGVYFLNTDYGPQAKMIGSGNDPEAQALIAKVKEAKSELEAWRNDPSNTTTEKGKTVVYYRLKPVEAKKEEAIIAMETALAEKHGVYDIQNKASLKEMTIRSTFSKYSSVIFTCVAEIFFEYLMAFCSMYDVRMLVYLRMLKNGGASTSLRTVRSKKAHALAV